jgi:DHA2 family multidrug resistance protein
MTLQSGSGELLVTMILQGIGFSCLFVPLNTSALSSVPKHLMPDATGLNSLFRQVGGSIGLAVFATLLGNHMVSARAALAAQLSPSRAPVQERLSGLQHGFIERGMDAASAQTAALQTLAGTVARQASVLAFQHVFLLAGVMFLMVLPLLPLLKVVRGAGSAPVETQHD